MKWDTALIIVTSWKDTEPKMMYEWTWFFSFVFDINIGGGDVVIIIKLQNKHKELLPCFSQRRTDIYLWM